MAGDESAEGGLDRGPVIGRIRLGELSGNSNMDKQKESVLSKERKPDNDEEVTKLRALLSAATSELSRQISSLNQKQGVDERLLFPISYLNFMSCFCCFNLSQARTSAQESARALTSNTLMQTRVVRVLYCAGTKII